MPSVYSPATLDLLYFEDLPLGGQWTTRRRTLTDADLALYRGVAGDLNPLHADLEHAAGTELGLSIPAPLLTAVALGLGSIDAPVPATVALVGMTWKYLRPLRPGQPMHARWRLNRKRDVENPRWGLATWQVDVIGPDGEVCAAGEVSRLIARRPAADGGGVAAEETAATPSSRRRRRRRSGGAGEPAAATETDSAPAPGPDVPEPAPADAPSPARRRRRRRGGGGGHTNGNGGNGGETRPEPAPAAESAPAPAAESAAPVAGEAGEAGIGRVLRRIRRR